METPPREPGPPLHVGRFRIRRELGRGGVGVVYHAFDPDRQRDVALKVLLAGDHASAVDLERFLREARAAAALNHPNLVRVRGTGWADGRPWLALDLVDGPSLAEVLERGPMPPDRAARLIRDVARGLEHAHRSGIVHRDVKPQNVLLGSDDVPRLTDFGLASQLGGDARLTRTGQLMGTPAYLAPEAARNAEPSPLADVYSLGAVLYHLLGGRPPYAGATAIEVIYAAIEGDPPALRTVAPTVPAALATVVQAAMAREPQARYPSAGALADDLDAYLAGRPVHPPSLGAVTLAVSYLRRRTRAAAWIGGAVVVGLIAVAGVGAVRNAVEADGRRDHQTAAETALAAIGTVDRPAALSAFADDPRFRDTPAAGRAWLELAQATPDRGARETRLAHAFAAGGPAEQDAALTALAEGFRTAWRFRELVSAITLMSARAPGAEDRPDVLGLRAEAAMFARDPAAAAPLLEALGRPGSALATRWASAVEGGPVEGAGSLVDTDGDGVREWWRPLGDAVVHTDPMTGAELARIPLGGAPWQVDVLPGSPGRVLASLGSPPREVVVLDADGSRRFAWTDSAHTDAVRVGDRTWVAIGAYGRHLVALDAGPDGAITLRRPLPELDALASDVLALESARFPPALPRALVIGSGAWQAFELRVVDPESGHTVWRQKHGHVSELVVEPTATTDAVWSLRDDTHPSRVVFPPTTPTGGRAGLTRWVWDGDGLAAEGFLAAPVAGAALLTNLVVADLDGDGVVDPVVAVGDGDGRWAMAVWPEGRADVHPWLVDDVVPLFAADLVPGGGAELVVQTRGPDPRWWVLGAGDGALPTSPWPPATVAPPADTDPLHAQAWRSAEDLAAMGLFAEAARTVASVPDARASDRAAALWDQAGRVDLAIDERRAAASRQPGDVRSRSLVDSLVRWHHLPDAVVAADAGAIELPEAVRRASAASVRWDVPLTPAPGAHPHLAPVADGTHVDAVTGDPDLAVSDWTSDGGELSVHLRVRIDRAEWGSGLVAEVPLPDGPARVGVRVWGGGGWYRREVFCSAGAAEHHWEDRDVDADEVVEVDVAMDLSAAAGSTVCRIRIGDERHDGRTDAVSVVPPGPLRLRLASPDHADTRGLLTSGTLRELSLSASGLRPAGDPVAYVPSPAWAAAAAGDATALLTALGPSPSPDDATCLLRTRLAAAGPALREGWPDRYPRWFELAWGAAFHAHPEDPALAAAWLSETEIGADALRGPAARDAAVVSARRARAWIHAGQLAAAHRDLLRASRVLDPDAAEAAGMSFDLAATWVEWSVLASEAGDPRVDEALAAARRYVAADLVDDLRAAALGR